MRVCRGEGRGFRPREIPRPTRSLVNGSITTGLCRMSEVLLYVSASVYVLLQGSPENIEHKQRRSVR